MLIYTLHFGHIHIMIQNAVYIKLILNQMIHVEILSYLVIKDVNGTVVECIILSDERNSENDKW